MKIAFFTSIVLSQLTLSSFAHADQNTFNCEAFSNDPKNQSFVLMFKESVPRIDFNNTGGLGATGTLNSEKSSSTETVYSMALLGAGDSIGVPTNPSEQEKITLRYFRGPEFIITGIAYCTKKK